VTVPRWLSVAGAVALGAAAPVKGAAQAVPWELHGVVRSAMGQPIFSAIIELGVVTARTDSLGRFSIQAARRDSLTMTIKRLGYAPVSTWLGPDELAGDTLLVLMNETAEMIEGIRVEARDLRSAMGFGSFEDRRAQGLGIYVTRDELTQRNSLRLSDVLRNKRGVYLMRLPSGKYGVRFSSFQSSRNCAPEVWLDGQRARGMEIDDVPANTVEAIELYRSTATTPFQFTVADGAISQRCGTIVIWTRVPGTP
jgi:hypothetical protein